MLKLFLTKKEADFVDEALYYYQPDPNNRRRAVKETRLCQQIREKIRKEKTK